MTNLQKLEVEASELREKLNELAGAEDTPENRAAIEEATERYKGVEARRRAAVLAGEGETREAREPGDAENRERGRLIGRSDIRRYVEAGLRNRALSGAEAELNAATDTPDNRLPWEMLAPEERADAVTNVPSDVERRPRRMLARIFADSVLDYLGVETPRVAAGEQLYTILTAGASPEPKAKGAAKDAEAGTLSAVTMKPVRVTAAYRYQVEDRALMAGMPEVLRRDLRAALREEFSDMALNGDGTDPNPAGFIGSTALGTAPDSPTSVAGFTEFRGLLIDGVDGKTAYTLGGVRSLLGVAAYKVAAASTNTAYQTDALAFMAERGGGVRSTSLITPSSKIEYALTYRAERGGGSAVMPTWQGVEIIEDKYTGAAKGEVRLQLIALASFRVLRAAAYQRAKLKVA